MEYKKTSLTYYLIRLSAMPLLLLGIGVIIIAAIAVYSNTEMEVKNGLNSLVHSVAQTYDLVYQGNYEYIEADRSLKKGDFVLSGNFTVVDKIKNASDTDITIFWGMDRVITSIRNPDGTRAVGTKAAEEVGERVLNLGEEYFSSHVPVNGQSYFGYYIPMRDINNQIVGMIFAGRSRSAVMTAVVQMIIKIFLLVLITLIISEVIALRYSRYIISGLNQIRAFLGEVAEGNLEADLDGEVLKRSDELGDMGRFATILQQSISNLVGTDPLTGLYNRRSGSIVINNLFSEFKKNYTPFVLAIGDIDWFKQINDKYGHLAGDKVLKHLSLICMEHMKKEGFVFRWGGEEFLFLYEGMDRDRAVSSLEDLLEKIRSAKVEYEGQAIAFTMTVGVAECTMLDTVDTLIRKADENLYFGKQNKKNQVV